MCWATSFGDAIGQLSREGFDLVITDYDLRSSGNGLDLLAHLQQADSPLPAILMSGKPPREVEARAWEALEAGS